MTFRSLPRRGRAFLALVILAPAAAAAQRATDTLSLDRALSYAFPSSLVTAPHGGRIAWVVDDGGRRNIWTADAPEYRPLQLTHYGTDDGQELTSLALTPDGSAVVYVRGGDHDGNWSEDTEPNPASGTTEPKIQMWIVPTKGGAPRLLGDGDDPVISPRGDRVVFTRSHQLWTMPLDSSASAADQLFFARGNSGSAAWSPDGSKLAFVSRRGDHGFVGVFLGDSTPIRWLAPSTSHDGHPEWSPDGAHIAFVRTPGSGGAPDSLLAETPSPWAIWIADVGTGKGRKVWQSPNTLHGSYPETQGGSNLHWAAGNRLLFLTDLDGWPHLYSIATTGGQPLLLTPGRFMAEFISMSPDGRYAVYSSNAGPDANDIDRRHLFRVSVSQAGPTILTPGVGNEWTPVVTGDGNTIAFLGGGTTTPPAAAVMPAAGGTVRPIGANIVTAYPAAQLVVPRKIVFKSADGTEIHGQLFARGDQPGRKPGVVFVHGGPPRQMLLGWHYSRYYSNAYGVNQYLANHGYVVITVNYRLGIGYGHDFHHPPHAGPWGESEYQDVKAAGEYLRGRADVDPARVGIWGGSYGGLLTALALARNSDIFKTGVDMHGVHDWPTDMGMWETSADRMPYEPNDSRAAMEVAWKSSPAADVAHWKSPVLLIQGDDDRNVRFHQTVDLAQRLTAQGVRFEELVIPDEIHDFLRHASWLAADRATVDWFGRELRGP